MNNNIVKLGTKDNDILELSEIHHILVCGNKSTRRIDFVKNFIYSIIKNKDNKIVIYDPDREYFEIFNGIQNLATSIITEPGMFFIELNTVLNIINDRVNILLEKKSKENKQYFKPIYIFIENISDLINLDKNELEKDLYEIMSIGRKVDIHIILSSSLSSKKYITPFIESLFPTKVCFKVNSKKCSTNVLDYDDASTLEENDEFCYVSSGDEYFDVEKFKSHFTDDVEILNFVNGKKK